jgi:hypothetical protein
MNRSTGSVARCAVLAILLGVGATFGVAPAARADDASVEQQSSFRTRTRSSCPRSSRQH